MRDRHHQEAGTSTHKCRQFVPPTQPMFHKLDCLRSRYHVPDAITGNYDTPVNRNVQLVDRYIGDWGYDKTVRLTVVAPQIT